MKNINNFTIKEFEQYKEMLNEDPQDIFGIMELFGINNPEDLPIDKYNQIWQDILGQTLSIRPVQRIYTINGKRYEAKLEVLNLNAAQFLDLQSYMNDFKIHEVLSVFLIPQYKKFLKWNTYKYNDGYDPLEVQKELYNHFNIGQASELSNFFFQISLNLLQVMTACLEKKQMKMELKKIKKEKKMLLG